MVSDKSHTNLRARRETAAAQELPFRRFQWVLFDFDGTLRHNLPDGLEVFADYASEHGLEISEARRRKARRWNMAYWASSDELREDAKRSGDDRSELYLRYAERHLRILGAAGDDLKELARSLHQRMREEYEPEDHVPADVHPALAQLRSDGYRLGLLTNRQELPQETMEKLDLSDPFEISIAAGETDWWKPDPRIFHHALERAGERPERALYVGDNPYADVEGARAAGVQPVLVDPDGLFPEVECPVIEGVGQLPSLLEGPSA